MLRKKNPNVPGFTHRLIFAERMRDRRKYCGYSQCKLAEALKINQSAISSYETAHSFPPPDVLVDICQLLDTTIDYLLGQTETPEGATMIKKYESLSQEEQALVAEWINIFLKKKVD